MSRKRRNFTAAQKVAILRRHLLDKVAVSDLCDEHGLHPTVFYRWQKQFFENGAATFQGQREQKAWQHRIRELESKLQSKNEVVSELLEEHMRLKKDLGESTMPRDWH